MRAKLQRRDYRRNTLREQCERSASPPAAQEGGADSLPLLDLTE